MTTRRSLSERVRSTCRVGELFEHPRDGRGREPRGPAEFPGRELAALVQLQQQLELRVASSVPPRWVSRPRRRPRPRNIDETRVPARAARRSARRDLGWPCAAGVPRCLRHDPTAPGERPSGARRRARLAPRARLACRRGLGAQQQQARDQRQRGDPQRPPVGGGEGAGGPPGVAPAEAVGARRRGPPCRSSRRRASSRSAAAPRRAARVARRERRDERRHHAKPMPTPRSTITARATRRTCVRRPGRAGCGDDGISTPPMTSGRRPSDP